MSIWQPVKRNQEAKNSQHLSKETPSFQKYFKQLVIQKRDLNQKI